MHEKDNKEVDKVMELSLQRYDSACEREQFKDDGDDDAVGEDVKIEQQQV